MQVSQAQAAQAAQAARTARRGPSGALLVALGALGVGLLGVAPLALSGLQRDAAALQAPAVTVSISAGALRFSPDGMRVPAGASVRIELTNDDPTSPHDIQTTGQYRDAHLVLWPGEKGSVGFIASRTPGRYTFICTVRGHAEAGMYGTIVVE